MMVRQLQLGDIQGAVQIYGKPEASDVTVAAESPDTAPKSAAKHSGTRAFTAPSR